jgi:ABC-type glycerol-3-phosphate transport system substrate-binding protein
MKKLASAIFIAAFFLSACGPPVTTKTPFATQASVKTPRPSQAVDVASRLGVEEDALNGLQIDVWHPWFGVEASLFQSMVEDFNGVNPWGIKVNASGHVNFSNLYDEVTISLPTENKPDLVIALPEHALGWDAEGVAVEMTPYIEDPLYGMDTTDITGVFWSQDHVGERRAAIPAQRTARVLLWNETWAGELGFDSPPESPNGFRQQSCRAHQSMRSDATPINDVKGGWIIDSEPMTAYAWLLAFEGGVLESNDYRFLTPNNIEAFTFLKKLVEDACVWQVNTSDPITEFATRQTLFISASLEDFPAVTRAFATVNNTDKWTVLPYPGTDSEAVVVYGSSYVMLGSSDEEQLASWLFIRWMLEPEQDARLVEATHLFPLRASTLDLLADYQGSHPQWAEAVKLIPDGELTPQLASWRIVKVMVGDAFHDMMSRTDLTSGQVARVLAQMQDTAHELNK